MDPDSLLLFRVRGTNIGGGLALSIIPALQQGVAQDAGIILISYIKVSGPVMPWAPVCSVCVCVSKMPWFCVHVCVR